MDTALTKLRKAFKSRTIWFAFLLAVLSVAQDFIVFIPYTPRVQAIIGVLIAIIVVLLRVITTGPLYEDE